MSPAPKKKGGARPGAGRKKRELVPAVAAPIDGRSNAGQSHAQYLIDQLNAIDPEMMERKELVVSPHPYEIPPNANAEQIKAFKASEAERAAMWKIKQAAVQEFRKLSFELQGWAPLWWSYRTGLETRKYLHDKAEGKAMQTLNHLHDKPVEHTVTHTLSERFRIAMEKAEVRIQVMAKGKA